MSDSSGDEGALQIDIGGSSEGIKVGGGKIVAGRTKKGWKPGDVVWAKVTGFNYWPAQVFDAVDDPLVPHWLKQPPRPTFMLVRFFGTYDMQWVSSNSAETFAKGFKKKFHIKSKRKVFVKAIKEARSFLDDGSLSEGMTLRPPDPAEEDQPGSADIQLPKSEQDPPTATVAIVEPLSSNHKHTCTTTTASHTNPPLSGSRRRKGSTPCRLSSSSSARSSEGRDTPSEVKKIKLDDDGVQPFTCAPLPLSTGGQQ